MILWGRGKETGKITALSPDNARTRTRTHLCVDIRYLLDRAAVPRAPVLRGNDAAISALAKFLDELVLRVDKKGRVQSIKTVSLHDGDDTVTVRGGRKRRRRRFYWW